VILLNAPITIAGTYTGNPFQFRTGSEANNPLGLCAQKSFTYGSGGTSVDTFLQTSLDGGNSWCDVVHWAQNTTSSDARPLIANVNAQNMLASPGAPFATTDGTATVNTTVYGLFGLWWRVKYIVAGTYATTTLRVDAAAPGLTTAGAGAFN